MSKLKLYLLFFAAGILCNNVNAQTILSEGFESATFPPTGWVHTPGASGLSWARYTASVHPTGFNPHTGVGMAGCNSWTVSSGTSDLMTPVMNFSTTSGTKMVSFWMYRDNYLYLGYNEGVRVYINTTNSTGGATLLGTVNRAIDMPPVVSTPGWYEYSFAAPASFSGATNYVIFQGYSAYGNDSYIDDVLIYNFIPCTPPSGLAFSGITSTSANLSWNAIGGTFGYQYVINTTAGAPAATVTPTNTATPGVNATGLTPATNYYLHVRNKCTASGTTPTDLSVWIDLPFTTYPPCTAPAGFTVTDLTTISATINWLKLISATSYDYIVNQDPATPGSSTGAATVTDTFDHLTGLAENTKYYVHIKANCAGNEQSPWSLDSFTTPIPCRAPTLAVSNINTSESVVYWDAVPTAFYYQYAIRKDDTEPATGGTKITDNNMFFNALDDGREYYVFVRSTCSSIGVVTTSDWAKISFKTFALNVNNLNNRKDILIYPNPAKNILNISTQGVIEPNTTVLISDITGKTLQTAQILEKESKIDISHLTPGMYLLKYNSTSGSQTIKITKQ